MTIQENLNNQETAQLGIGAVSGSALTEKQLRKMAKKCCDGHQHTMRYGNMLNACFKMGKMMLEELERQKADH